MCVIYSVKICIGDMRPHGIHWLKTVISFIITITTIIVGPFVALGFTALYNCVQLAHTIWCYLPKCKTNTGQWQLARSRYQANAGVLTACLVFHGISFNPLDHSFLPGYPKGTLSI